jgi:hypothetical protein
VRDPGVTIPFVADAQGHDRAGRLGLRPWLACVAALASLLAVGVPSADAARGLATGIYEPQYSYADEAERNRLFDETVAVNASVVRIGVAWDDVAGSQPPADPRNPSDPSYDFANIDRAVREAQERGLQVMFSVARTPPWAVGPNRPPGAETPAVNWNPDPAAYGAFGQALATRYSGTFPDPSGSGQPLPRVRHYATWSEPNLAVFFGPQWDGSRPVSPTLFRQLLNSFYAGVKAVHSDNLVIAPALAPYGDPPGGSRMRPLLFLREFFCLKGRRHPTSKKQCSKSEIPRLDVLSHHPINLFGAPPDHADHPDDATSGDLDRVKRVLRAAEKAGNVKPRGRHPLWVTESFWYSNPPTDFGFPPAVQARYIEQSLYLFWRAGAEVVINFLVQDAVNSAGQSPAIFGTGVFFQDGTPKPAYDAFRFPFVADRKGKGKDKVLAWGKTPATGELEIQRQVPDGWQTVKRLSVNDGAVFTASLRIRGAATLRAVVGSDASLPWDLAG